MTTVWVRFACVGVLGLFGTVVQADPPQHWRIDPVHSRVVLKVSHAGFSDSMATLSAITGSITLDPQDWSSAQVQAEIPLHSLDFGDADWNRRMARGDFFAVKRNPVARFVSTRVIGQDETHAEVHGILHFRAEEVPVVLQVQRNALGRKLPWLVRWRIGFSAHATLLRRDFGIDRYSGVVGDEVRIDLQIEAERSRD